MSRCLFAAIAEEDIEIIAEFIARDSPERARAFASRLRQKCEAIAATPKAYPSRPDLATNLRCAVEGRYLIFYSEHTDHILIERILHGSRKLDDLL